jgi:uracil-DNA glycosylase
MAKAFSPARPLDTHAGMKSSARKEYLAALGIESWVLRSSPAPAELSGTAGMPGPAPRQEPLPPQELASQPARAPRQEPAPREESAPPQQSAPRHESAPRLHPAAPRREEGDWAQLRARVAACTRCSLSSTRTQTVFGVGSLEAEWLIVGEAPGAEEDRRGEPFVGRAGQLLNSMLRAIGLAREQVYIANVLKCRPPGNRDPAPGEVMECLPYLERQIALLKPKILLAVGRISAQNLLQTDTPLGRLRLKVHSFGLAQVPLVVTYHPAYLLRTPADKRKAWEDLKFAREVCASVQR